MKIVHLVSSLEVGGAEVVVASLCRLHRQWGHEVAVHCVFREGSLGQQLAAEGIPVVVHAAGGRFPGMASLYRGLRGGNWDVGHCHNMIPTVWGAPVLRAAGARVVVSTRHSLVRPPYHVREELQYSLCSRFCSRVVGVCEATSRNLRNAPLAAVSRVVTLYNGAAEPAGAANPADREGFGGCTFVMLSRLAEPKDHATLLRAFARLNAASPGHRLWVVGDGPLRAELEQLASQLNLAASVTFWGERQDPGRFLRSADVFVLSSCSEGLPMSLLEAISAGLPAIVTDVGGMAEVVREANLGAVLPVGDAVALGDAMAAYARDPGLRQEAGLRARDCYRSRFTLEIMADAYLKLYQQSM